jgi:hypothetical protein
MLLAFKTEPLRDVEGRIVLTLSENIWNRCTIPQDACMVGTSCSLLESLARSFGIDHQVAGTARLDCRTHVELLSRLWISASASSADDRSCFNIVSHFRAQN